MSNAPFHPPASTGITPSASFPMSATLAPMPAATREDAYWERRWQLEWDRRNVED
jgi:hypothetical protein